jgi:hypothetical protein
LYFKILFHIIETVQLINNHIDVSLKI